MVDELSPSAEANAPREVAGRVVQYSNEPENRLVRPSGKGSNVVVVASVRGLWREVVVGHTATWRVNEHRKYRVPRGIIGLHHEKPIEARDDDRGLANALIPQREVPAVLERPTGRAVVEQIKSAVSGAADVMAVVDVRVQEVTSEHHRKPASVELGIGLQPFHAGNVGYGFDNEWILEGVGNVRENAGKNAEVLGGGFPLPHGVLPGETLSPCREGVVNRGGNVRRQEIVNEEVPRRSIYRRVPYLCERAPALKKPIPDDRAQGLRHG